MREIRLLRTASEKSLLDREDLEATIPLFRRDLLRCRTYLASFDGGAVVGLVGFAESSRRVPGAFGIAFISTHVRHRRQGVARELVDALFALALSQGKALATTQYGPLGRRWLRPVLRAASKRYPGVRLLES